MIMGFISTSRAHNSCQAPIAPIRLCLRCPQVAQLTLCRPLLLLTICCCYTEPQAPVKALMSIWEHCPILFLPIHRFVFAPTHIQIVPRTRGSTEGGTSLSGSNALPLGFPRPGSLVGGLNPCGSSSLRRSVEITRRSVEFSRKSSRAASGLLPGSVHK